MYVFIFGPQRTGSTLLHRLLEAHPEIDSTPNDLNLLDIRSSGIPDTPKWRQWELENSDVEPLMLLKPYAFLRQIVDRYFEGTANKIKLHKTCKGEYALQTYQRAFRRQVKFIYILRNPLGIMASRKYWEQPDRVNEWVNLADETLDFTKVSKSFRYIKRHLDRIFQSIDIIDWVVADKDTLAVVNYEQLVNNPTRVVGGLFAELELKLKSLSLVDGSRRKPIDPYTSHKELEGKQGIYTNAIEIWKKKLTKFEIQLMYNEMVAFHNRRFNSKLVSSLFGLYLDRVRKVVGENATSR